MKRILFYGWLLIPVLIFSGQTPMTPMKDRPLKGEWSFCPEKIWEANKAGNDDFGRIAELLVSDQGYIYIRDFEHNISYIFDEKGHFLKKFAPQGNEEGQLSRYLNRFQAGEKIVLATPDKLHFFSQDGTFEHSVENNLFLRFPLFFLNENKFVYAPNLPQSPVHQKKMILFDIPSDNDKILVDFAEPETNSGDIFQGPMVMIFSLTPQVRLDYDGKKMVFGRSDQYQIFIADQTGKILSSFSLDRKRKTASIEDKRHHFANSKIPEERVEKIVAQLPDEMTYFSHIDSINGFIYIFAVTNMGPMTTSQQIDIFSEKGEYIYSGKIEFGENLQFGSPSNLVIKDEYLYVILKNDDGKQTLAKYSIKLPQ
jgi:hypothetical protein